MTVADPTLDPSLDPALRSWVPVADDSDFPIQNLPFGVFRSTGGPGRVGVAIGDRVLDVSGLHTAGRLDHVPGLETGALETGRLNDLMALGPTTWRPLRRRLSALLATGNDEISGDADRWLFAMADVEMLLPVEIGDYVDFYSSIHHAGNVGAMFRPDDPPLLPNWRSLPVAYHGRSSSVVVSGTPVVRPHGQRPGRPGGGGPTFGPTAKLDIELEVGFVTGPGNPLGTPIPIDAAEDHIFGLCLVNDWSARDLQAWEYRPLGPFLGKSFATTMSPWVVTLDALAPFRVPGPAQDPAPLAYLAGVAAGAVDIRLEVELNGVTISAVDFAGMYWTMAQQLAHATANGTNTRPGDLYASGTVSGPDPGSLGSLLELSWNGTRPVTLADGTTRTFLEDGDTVVLRGSCTAAGFTRIGFGSCSGTVVPAIDIPSPT
jgi:fumarylacetoacetase